MVLSRARATKLADMQPATLGMAVSRERILDVKVLDREQMRVVSSIPFYGASRLLQVVGGSTGGDSLGSSAPTCCNPAVGR